MRGARAIGEGEVEFAAVAKVEGAEVCFGAGAVNVGLENLGCEGTLEGDQSAVFEDGPFDAVGAVGLLVGGDLGLQEGEILVAPAGVGDKVEGFVSTTGDDGIVDDTAGAFFEQTRESGLVVAELIKG